MELLQSTDPAHLALIAVGCALLCLAIFVIGFVLQAVGGIVDAALGLLQIVADVAQGGPVAWCGCALLAAALIAGAGIVVLLLNAPESCAAFPTRFCQWFGFLP